MNADSLLNKSESEIERALGKTNEEYGMVGWLPSPSAVQAWVAAARLLESAGVEESESLSTEQRAEVRESAVMIARPVLGAELREAGIALDAIPIARFVGDPPKARTSSGAVTQIVTEPTKRGTKRRKKTSESLSKKSASRDGVVHTQVKESIDIDLGDEEMAFDEASVLEKSESSYQNTENLAYLQRNHERRNNGMTHKAPMRVVVSASATLISSILGWTAIITVVGVAGYSILMSETLPFWLLYVMLVIPASALLYVLLGLQARCRLCGYRLFRRMGCRKHEKAHRSIFGTVFATAWQVVWKGYWRCMYCGTKQKLK